MPGALDVHDLIRAAVAITIAAAAAAHEGRTRTIPSSLSLPPIALGFALVVVDGRLGATIGGLVLSAFAALVLLGTRRLAGGGAPLAIALGACVGLTPALYAWIAAVILTFAVTGLHARVYPDAADACRPTLLSSRIALVAITVGVAVDLALQARTPA
ncbi:hypothetical protein [Sandaracinus amylolyticus]|uniref:Uncharacterized protein n=1 Tax=Sandaracinus amylolyticus TaxID=927083 RepID=A0A0F6W9P0_9BACT|nr:hypothetical protein [Sandaracinus amylolyticus]AKF10921.1 hypothetical protein DB32_008070 [Sandaracinus amylolyticus]